MCIFFQESTKIRIRALLQKRPDKMSPIQSVPQGEGDHGHVITIVREYLSQSLIFFVHRCSVGPKLHLESRWS